MKRINRRQVLQWIGMSTLVGVGVGAATTSLVKAGGDHRTEERADITIFVGANTFQAQYSGDRNPMNAPIEFSANRRLLIRFLNEDKILHEIHFGKGQLIDLGVDGSEAHRVYEQNLFGVSGFMGLHLNPGQDGFLHLYLNEAQKGEWEIGCLLSGHYESGMHAPLSIV